MKQVPENAWIKDRVKGYVGMAAKAGYVVSGEALCRRALHSRKRPVSARHLIVLAEDVHRTVRARFVGLSQGKRVPMVTVGTKEDLGWWVGKSPRSALLIRDMHLAKAILRVVREAGKVEPLPPAVPM